MAKFDLRLQARDLRKKGVSVKQIANQLGVAKSTASIWVRDIILSIEQLERLKKNQVTGRERGQLTGALKQKEKWQHEMQQAVQVGEEELKNLTNRELLIAGIALYWGEGSKKNRTIEFCNSDPKMIQFLLVWLHKCFFIEYTEITCWLSINEIHRSREEKVKQYWSTITSIPLSQFSGTSFKKVINKKVYDNIENHFGTLFFRVKKPAQYYKKIIGLIEGLYRVTQRELLITNSLAG